jgi:stress response protein YsnF
MSILNLEGAYENELAATGEFNPQAPKTALMLPSGQRVVLPTEVLLQALQGGVAARAGEEVAPVTDGAATVGVDEGVRREGVGEQVIPLVEEEMVVGKAVVETGRVRVRRETEEVVQKVSVPLANVSWEVEHVPVERLVEGQPEIRQVGDTTIFPLVEERVVMKRELWLREEVHVRRVVSTVEKSAEFPVKRDVLVEERLEADGRVR